MSKSRTRLVMARGAAWVSLLFAGLLIGTDAAPGEQPDADGEAPVSREDARLEAMEDIAEAIELATLGKSGRAPVELLDGPRFRFSAPENGCYDATVWIWGTQGRPVALLTLSAERSGPASPDLWAYELTSLSPTALRATGRADWIWTPKEAGLQFEPVPDAPRPAGTAAGRLRQMKSIARRFDAYGLYDADNRRVELRILPTPLHRYEDEAAGIRDGALFSIAGGTNPEALLAVELSESDEGDLHWRFALNRVTSGEVHASLNGREVWKCPRMARADPANPYYLFQLPMTNDQ